MKGKATIKRDIEILSPVGSEEMLIAAVRSGADAVYLGLRDFNARRNADNFGPEELINAVKYCHARAVSVYLTLNTVIRDDEFETALSAAQTAYNAGVDAVIVQDLGLARAIKKHLPDLAMHASTQLTAHSPAALPFLKELGFCQVVASREMSEKELSLFCQKAKELDMTVEVFVHGALCMCMSGQCYLSSMLGSRSGNRGLCAGPCRLPFSSDETERYDLSLKDLSIIRHIEKLKEMGVASLKIEGRMKRPEYVAAATAVCRAAADGEDYSELYDTLSKVFSRSGFTDGYFTSNLGPDMFGIRTRDDVLDSASVIKKLHELYRKERQTVEIEGEFCALPNQPISFSVFDGENKTSVSGDVPETALNRPLDRDFAITQLCKTGSTPFLFKGIKANIGESLSVSAGALNALRREALEKLQNARYKERFSDPIEFSYEKNVKKKEKPALFAYFSSLSQIPKDLFGIDKIILPLESDFLSAPKDIPLCLNIPRGIDNEGYILSRLREAMEAGISEAFCGNIAAVTLCKEAGITPYFDFSMNVFNSESVSVAESFGAAGATLSFELSASQLNSIGGNIPLGIIAYGRVPLMLTRNCPLRNTHSCADCDKNGVLTDRMGIQFPVRCRGGYSEVLNSRPIYLAERLSEFNVDYMTLYFTIETGEECRNVIDRYVNRTPASGEFTRGLYYRSTL